MTTTNNKSITCRTVWVSFRFLLDCMCDICSIICGHYFPVFWYQSDYTYFNLPLYLAVTYVCTSVLHLCDFHTVLAHNLMAPFTVKSVFPVLKERSSTPFSVSETSAVPASWRPIRAAPHCSFPPSRGQQSRTTEAGFIDFFLTENRFHDFVNKHILNSDR